MKVSIFAVLFLALFCFACDGGESAPVAKEAAETPAPTVDAAKKRTFEDDLSAIRYREYTFVFVLRRKDRKAFDSEDNRFLRANSPGETNQRLVSDDGRALIMGTNFRFYPGQWDMLNQQFDLEDLSAVKYERNQNDDAVPPGKSQGNKKSPVNKP